MTALDIELQSVTKSYGAHPVVRNLNLSVPRGEFVSILGPSGCGKTTTLNMIAGFATPSSGDIRIRGKSQVRVSPEHRNIGLVFQNYALFPHMTVAENVGFGLKMRKLGKAEMGPRITEALASVHLSGFADRYPRELSGGQQQRVALARAITQTIGSSARRAPFQSRSQASRGHAHRTQGAPGCVGHDLCLCHA